MTTDEKRLKKIEKIEKIRQDHIFYLTRLMSDMSFDELSQVRNAIFDITYDRKKLDMLLKQSTGTRS